MSDNRERLQQAALDSVQRGGLQGLSFRTLADEIGIKSSSVHYHFPEKSDLARTLIKRYNDEFFQLLDDIATQRWSLRKKMRAFIDIFERVANDDKLCLCGMMAAELEQLDASNRKLLRDYFENTEQWLYILFDQHKDQLNMKTNTRILARSLLSGLEGALLLDRVVGNSQRLKAQRELFMSVVK